MRSRTVSASPLLTRLLRALNAPANQGIDGVAGALDTAATTFGPQVQPLDKTVKQTADLLRGVEAPPGG